MGNLWVAQDDLAHHVLAQVLAFDRVDGQHGPQFIKAFQEQSVAFLGNLFGFADGNQDTAQVVEQDEMIGNDVGHESKSSKAKTGARVYSSRARFYMTAGISGLGQVPGPTPLC